MTFRVSRAFLMLACLGQPVAAQSPIAPEAFEAMSEGRTLHFSLAGEPFGSEQYFPGRRSLWRFVNGDCEAGVWHAAGDQVCFVYESDLAPQCWHFLQDGGKFRATLFDPGAPDSLTLELTGLDAVPLDCPGPDVGS